MHAAAQRQVVNLESVMAEIAAKMDSAAYKSWIVPCKPSICDDFLVLDAHNQFSADFIKSVYFNLLKSIAGGFDLGLRVGVAGAGAPPAVNTANDNALKTFVPMQPAPAPALRSFDSFVMSDENAFVVSACKKLAAGAASFSPLFIYGPSGCGKSLLAECINSSAAGRAVMFTGGQFVYEFARSLREHSIFAFKDFCRNCDTFIMDDVHVLAGKKATTDEFLQLIMDLRAANKNVVLTANVSPNNLSGFERRIQSLLASGLVADVAAPARQVKKTMLSRGGVNPDVADMLASRIGGDGHLVSGVAKKIQTYSELMGMRVTIEIAEKLLSDTLAKNKTPVSMVKSMCEKLGVSYEAACGRSRHRTVVRARQIMMTALKSATKMSLAEIGRACGDRDHATVLYAISQIEKLKSSDLILSAELAQMIAELK